MKHALAPVETRTYRDFSNSRVWESVGKSGRSVEKSEESAVKLRRASGKVRCETGKSGKKCGEVWEKSGKSRTESVERAEQER